MLLLSVTEPTMGMQQGCRRSQYSRKLPTACTTSRCNPCMRQHAWKQIYCAGTFITVGEGWGKHMYTDTHGVYLPMHALEEVRGQCWASPSITLLCLILRKSLGESRAHQLPRLVLARLGYLPVSTHPSGSGVTVTNTQRQVLTIALYQLTHLPSPNTAQHTLL